MTVSFMPSQTELAWAAGFYDGEGSAWHRHPVRTGERPSRGAKGQVRVSITQCDPEVLYRFRDAVGVGNVAGPYKAKNRPNASRYWTYEAYKFREATAVMAHLWKFLSPVKRRQFHDVFTAHHTFEAVAA